MKDHSYIRFIGLLLVLFLFTQCRQTNWYENFREKEKSPFGTYILYNEAEKLFNNNEIVFLREHIYDYLTSTQPFVEDTLSNYVCVKGYASKLEERSINDLIRFVYDGNNAFIALNYFSEDLKELLDFETINADEHVFGPVNLKELKGTLHLENQDFNQQNFTYDRNLRRHYFTSYNDAKTLVLGTQKIAGQDQPVFIKIYHGKGAFYLHTQPIAFTNYFLLSNNNQYAENVLSYLPEAKVLWDPQIKSSNFTNTPRDRESVFKFFWQNPSLKWSLYVFFFSLLLFMLFNARRKQRPIPFITPLNNSTVEFTHTIANLYLKENDHKNLVDKKIQYFLEKVRRKYLIDTSHLNNTFVERLALKSGNSLEATNYLVNTIIALNKKYECSQNELYRLNNLIENFFNPNKNGRSK